MREGMLFGAFLGDAFPLGTHGVYDTAKIDSGFDNYNKFPPLLNNSLHKTKSLGEQTNYGDQMMFLLESIVCNSGFNPKRFKNYWVSKMQDYTGYMDKASKISLENYNEGLRYASDSTELGASARIAPIIYFYQDEDKGIESCLEQTSITHNSERALACTEFFARLMYRVLMEEAPSLVIKSLEKEFENNRWLHREIENAIKSVPVDTRKAIKELGQSCDTSESFASTLHLILKYENDFKTAMVENIKAGGDTAVRGGLAGMVIGAYIGFDKLPKDWLLAMKSMKKIESLIYR